MELMQVSLIDKVHDATISVDVMIIHTRSIPTGRGHFLLLPRYMEMS